MFLGLFFLFLTSCTKNYINTTNLILTDHSKQICKEENLQICGMGGAMMNLITEVSVAFQTERRVDICEARYLIVKCIERLKNALNSNGRIREHLSPYPFSNRGMDISIIFIKNDGTLVDYGNVCEGDGGVSAVYQLNDKLYYPSYNACTKQLERYYIESYEEAVFWMGNAPLRMNFKRALTFDEVSIHTEE